MKKTDTMNAPRLKGMWNEVRGKVQEQWGKLTNDDLDVIAGERDQLIGRIQQRYGKARADVEREIDTWESRQGLR
jgi:uncharacterized protein YjbJ (UPF0337 family)